MIRTLGAMIASMALAGLLFVGGIAGAVEENSIVGTWEIDFQAMRDALGAEYVAGADATLTDNAVTMVFNADNTGSHTQILSGQTTVRNGTWSVVSIVGDTCEIAVDWGTGSGNFTYTFSDADTITWTEPGLPTPVVMRRQP